MRQQPITSKYEILIDGVASELSMNHGMALNWKKLDHSRQYLIHNPGMTNDSGYFINFGEDAVDFGVRFGISPQDFSVISNHLQTYPEILPAILTQLSGSFYEVLLQYWSIHENSAPVRMRALTSQQLDLQARQRFGFGLERVSTDLAPFTQSNRPQFLVGVSCRRRLCAERLARSLRRFDSLFTLTLMDLPAQQLSSAS